MRGRCLVFLCVCSGFAFSADEIPVRAGLISSLSKIQNLTSHWSVDVAIDGKFHGRHALACWMTPEKSRIEWQGKDDKGLSVQESIFVLEKKLYRRFDSLEKILVKNENVSYSLVAMDNPIFLPLSGSTGWVESKGFATLFNLPNGDRDRQIPDRKFISKDMNGATDFPDILFSVINTTQNKAYDYLEIKFLSTKTISGKDTPSFAVVDHAQVIFFTDERAIEGTHDYKLADVTLNDPDFDKSIFDLADDVAEKVILVPKAKKTESSPSESTK